MSFFCNSINQLLLIYLLIDAFYVPNLFGKYYNILHNVTNYPFKHPYLSQQDSFKCKQMGMSFKAKWAMETNLSYGKNET